MRPGDFSPGNAMPSPAACTPATAGFNEAGGFLPRKLATWPSTPTASCRSSFNEAGGFLPRKHHYTGG